MKKECYDYLAYPIGSKIRLKSRIIMTVTSLQHIQYAGGEQEVEYYDEDLDNWYLESDFHEDQENIMTAKIYEHKGNYEKFSVVIFKGFENLVEYVRDKMGIFQEHSEFTKVAVKATDIPEFDFETFHESDWDCETQGNDLTEEDVLKFQNEEYLDLRHPEILISNTGWITFEAYNKHTGETIHIELFDILETRRIV